MTNQKKKKLQKNKKDTKLSLADHLSELRTRLILVAVIFIITTSIGYLLSNTFITFLTNPLKESLIFTSPSGGFNFRIQVAMLFGFLITIPFILQQTLAFISPVFPYKFTKIIYIFLFLSFLLSIAGVSSAYYIFLPATLHFFQKFSGPHLKALIVAQEYLQFISWYFIGFAIFFQLPVILIAINYFHRLSLRILMSYQKHVILISFVLAAFLTPTPDFINQTVVAVPIVVLYEMSILLILLINHFDILKLNPKSDKK